MNKKCLPRQILRAAILTAGALVLLFGLAAALEVPERPVGRIHDETGTLKPDEVAALDRELAAFERETSNQIAVLLIPSLQGDSLEDYSIRLAEKWKIGQKGKNNGVILLIAKNDRKIRIEVGYGLEGALPDSLAGSIIRNEIAPFFRRGLFFEGIRAGTQAIMAATKGEYRGNPHKGKSAGDARWAFVPFVLFMVIFTLFTRFLARKRRYYHGGRGGWHSGGIFWGGFPGGGFSGGGGNFGGGGGGFGGGGASGSW